MADFTKQLTDAANAEQTDFNNFVAEVKTLAEGAGYHIVELNADKPWGAYLRIDSAEADRFVTEFFPGLSPEEARLGVSDAELSPKFLIVKSSERLSWQFHYRRAERWRFLTQGAYRKSMTDDEGERIEAAADEVVQFQTGERHRLEGMPGHLVLVAEIWQHSDANQPSDEDDIVRLADDYSR
jgi:mannose-6-phosphate isomerase